MQPVGRSRFRTPTSAEPWAGWGWQRQLLSHRGLSRLARVFKEKNSPFPRSDQPALTSVGSQQLHDMD